MKITDDFNEMAELGHNYILEHPGEYPDDYIPRKMKRFGPFFDSESELLTNLYAAVYCRQMYGTSIEEFAEYRFAEKSHGERTQYVTWDSRFIYMAFLNKASENHILNNKYEAYTFLKPFYKREAMLLSNENDYGKFCSFAEKNPDIFVKPNNLDLAEGAHRLIYTNNDLRDTFDALLNEASNISGSEVKRETDHRLILEELIVPSAFIRQLNPEEMSLLRVTTINIKGRVHFFYPCLRLLLGDGKKACGEDYSCVALIDPDSGKVVTDGKNGSGNREINPVTGSKIRGMVMPEWKELKDMLTRAAEMLPATRYIGWDVTHTDRGWCIIEGNPEGEFFYQMCAGHGVKEEFEDLIGFRVPYDFWKDPMFRKNKFTRQPAM